MKKLHCSCKFFFYFLFLLEGNASLGTSGFHLLVVFEQVKFTTFCSIFLLCFSIFVLGLLFLTECCLSLLAEGQASCGFEKSLLWVCR